MNGADYTKCKNGHLFDPREKTECPYCPRPTMPQGGSNLARRRDTPASVSTVVENSGGMVASDGSPTVVDRQDTPSAGATVIEQPGSSSGSESLGGAGRKTRTLSQVEQQRNNRPIFAWLVLLEGRQQYEVFRIDQEQIYLGRSGQGDVVLDDDFVSSEHASIRCRDGQFFITDLDSKNGTFVNDFAEEARIDRVELKDGDDIRLGGVEFKFKCL